MNKTDELQQKYLELLSEKYPTIAAASTEIINLEAILNLPKGTEHMLSDIHGEGDQFFHILKNGSGAVRRKIEEVFGNTISLHARRQLATIIYYPEEKLRLIKKDMSSQEELDEFYRVTLNRLLRVCRHAQTKYTRSKVRKALPADFAYILEERSYEQADVTNKEAYYNEIINTIIRIGKADDFIVELSELIQRLTIDHLHIVGDIFDRGPDAAAIMDKLMEYHSVDIQWGNHDELWMGAASGSPCCIANVVRISARYGNLDTLEDDYGINMIPLSNLARSVYGDDPCTVFKIKHVEREEMSVGQIEEELEMKMHKAISIIQFKLEGQLIMRHPEWHMDDRMLLDKMDLKKGTIMCYGKEYPLLDTNFPTVDPNDPYKLTDEEQEVVDHLIASFRNCERLQRHVQFMFTQGSLYLVYNDNLLFHGCMPFDDKGEFREVTLQGRTMHGKELFDYLESCARQGYYYPEGSPEKQYGMDIQWYIWCNADSPLFGKKKMATFERYFIAEKETHEEYKDIYYKLIEDEKTCDKIMIEFGLDPKHAHIINGHVPVRTKKGESPIKGNGKLLIIDGGFSKAYQGTTGIAGYTLIYNSYGLRLVTHMPFKSREEAIREETDIHSDTQIVHLTHSRRLVADTDRGKQIKKEIADLEQLLAAYRNGTLHEKNGRKDDSLY